jgi:hypothetical protein
VPATQELGDERPADVPGPARDEDFRGTCCHGFKTTLAIREGREDETADAKRRTANKVLDIVVNNQIRRGADAVGRRR